MKSGVCVVAQRAFANLLSARINSSDTLRLIGITDSYEDVLPLIARFRPSILIVEVRHPVYHVQNLITELHNHKRSLTLLFFYEIDAHTMAFTHTADPENPLIEPTARVFREALGKLYQCVLVTDGDSQWKRVFHVSDDYLEKHAMFTEILRGMSKDCFRKHCQNHSFRLKGHKYYLFIYEQMGTIHPDHIFNKDCYNFVGRVMEREFCRVLDQFNGGEFVQYTPLTVYILINDLEVSSIASKRKLLEKMTSQLCAVGQRTSGFCFMSPLITDIDEVHLYYQKFETHKINHFFCQEKSPLTISELAVRQTVSNYATIQQYLGKIKDAITYDRGTDRAEQYIEELFLAHLKPSFDIDLYFYCVNVLKNIMLSTYGEEELLTYFNLFSITEFMFSSIEKECDKLTSLLSTLNAQYVGLPSMKHRCIYQAVAYIKENYMNDLSVREIADAVHINSAYLGQLFKKKTGITLAQYLANYRVKIAIQYLKGTARSVTEISALVGFHNVQYFSKMFKKQTGCSPMQYRNQSVNPKDVPEF